MTDQTPNTPATIPEQPEAKPPLRKGMPVVIALVAILAILGIANVTSLLRGNKKTAPASCFTDASGFTERAAGVELRDPAAVAGAARRRGKAEATGVDCSDAATPGCRDARPRVHQCRADDHSAARRDLRRSPNAPQHTSNVSEAHAEAKQRALAREKQKQEAINSGTVAIDFAHSGEASSSSAVVPPVAKRRRVAQRMAQQGTLPNQPAAESKANAKADPMGSYEFDQYQGRLYRIFEGTVLEGVVTNHIDGGFSGPILVMLTTDYYSHDHQQLLMPQGTRLIGTVQSVGNAQQRKMFVTFHRAVCPDGFSLDFDKYIGLDPIGTTGLATKVDHGYSDGLRRCRGHRRFGWAHQIGNNGSTLSASTEIRNGISEQSPPRASRSSITFLTACRLSRSRKALAPACT